MGPPDVMLPGCQSVSRAAGRRIVSDTVALPDHEPTVRIDTLPGQGYGAR
jgi:hypothetical protein